MRAWNINLKNWPGSRRAKIRRDRDVVSLSPDGQHLCLLYATDEEPWPGGTGRIVGYLALLKGPPQNPTLLLRPNEFMCYAVEYPIQWLGQGRYCVVQASGLRPYLRQRDSTVVRPFELMFLDTREQTFAQVDEPRVHQALIFDDNDCWRLQAEPMELLAADAWRELRIRHEQLRWYPWHLL